MYNLENKVSLPEPAANSIVQTKATVKFATAATPTSHHITTKEGNTGMKDVAKPLANMRNEKRRMECFLPQMSDTIPATKVPTAKPEKKIIFETTGRLDKLQTRSHSETIVSCQNDWLYPYAEHSAEHSF